MTGMKRVKKVRTLEQAAPEASRPACENCGKRLPPETGTRVLGGPETPPDHGSLPRWRMLSGADTPRPYALVLGVYERSFSYSDKIDYEARVWEGTFKGVYDRGDGTPLFCKKACAAEFGRKAFVAGYRRAARPATPYTGE